METIRARIQARDRIRPRDADHLEWLIDEGLMGSFPASDPSSIAQPNDRWPSKRKEELQ